MTNPNYVATALVVDRSGSMSFIQKPTQDAINEFIQGERVGAGKRTIRITQFDWETEIVHASLQATEVPEYILQPRGSTALLDAIGETAVSFGEELAALPENERPGSVVFLIMTDGEENSSKEWTYDRVKALLEQQQNEWNWDVRFMSAGLNPEETGAAMGVAASSVIAYAAAPAGVQNVVSTMSGITASAASGGRYAYTDKDRKAAQEK